MPLVVTAFAMLPTLPDLYTDQDNEQDPISTTLEDYKDFTKALMSIQKDDDEEEDVSRETKGKTRYSRPAPLGDRTNVQETRERGRPFASFASPNILTYAEAASKPPPSPAVPPIRVNIHEDRAVTQPERTSLFLTTLKNSYEDAKKEYNAIHDDNAFELDYDDGVKGNCQRLRMKAQECKDLKTYYNDKAAVVNFYLFNPEYSSGKCDLHALTVREAKQYAKNHIRLCLEHNATHFEIITGWGKNTIGGPVAARLKPEIQELFRSLEPAVRISPQANNTGAFYIDIEDAGELRRLLDASPVEMTEDDTAGVIE